MKYWHLMDMAEKIRKIRDLVDWRDEVSICRYLPEIFNFPDVVIIQRNYSVSGFYLK